MDLTEKKIIGLNFELSVSPKYVVKIKDVINKYAKEIGLKIYQNRTKDAEGELKYSIGLEGFVKPIKARESLDILIGLLEDIFIDFGVGIDDERARSLNRNYLTITEGKGLGLKNVKERNVYYVRHFGENIIVVYSDIENILKLEKNYDKLVRKIFVETPNEWYQRNVETLGKMFLKKSNLKSAKAIVDIFENKTNIKKIPHKKTKWGFILK